MDQILGRRGYPLPNQHPALAARHHSHAIYRAETLVEQDHIPIRQADVDLDHFERRVSEDMLKAERIAAVYDVLRGEGVP